MNKLGRAYRLEGSPQKGEAILRESLAVCDRSEVPAHETLSNLAILLVIERRKNEAVEYSERAVAEAESLVEIDHWDLAMSRLNLANLYQQLDRFSDAVPLLEQAIDELRLVVEEDDDLALELLEELVKGLELDGATDEALELAIELVEITPPEAPAYERRAEKLRELERSDG